MKKILLTLLLITGLNAREDYCFIKTTTVTEDNWKSTFSEYCLDGYEYIKPIQADAGMTQKMTIYGWGTGPVECECKHSHEPKKKNIFGF